jgi:HPt (histidine-containing phosphotransfer) domain-containing protein
MINASKREKELDLGYLRQMSGDSAEFMIEMLDTLVEQIPGYLNDLRDAIVLKDWSAVSGFAHKVKPTFYYVGREDLRDCMQQIEINSKELLNLENMQIAMDEIDLEMKLVVSQIAKAKSELQKRL